MEERARIREEEKQRRKIERFQALIAVCMQQKFYNFLFAFYLDFQLCSVFPRGKPLSQTVLAEEEQRMKKKMTGEIFRLGTGKEKRGEEAKRRISEIMEQTS